jgi:hypothetical protein
MRRILKWGGIAVASVLVLAITLLAIGLAINARDEPLTPQAKSLLVLPPNPYPSEDNIYVALAGFDAPPGESLTAVGEAKIDAYNTRLAATLLDPRPQSLYTDLRQDSPGGLRFNGKCDFLQQRRSYWNDLPPHRAEVEKLLTDNVEILKRYQALHLRHGYYETATPSQLAPFYYVPPDLRALFLADAVLRLRSPDAGVQRAALTDLQDDVRLWRTVLTGEGTLISKMLAVAYIHWDERVLAELIADPQAALPDAADEANALAPLFAPEDWNIGRVFFSEFRLQAAMLQQTHRINEGGLSFVDDSAGPVRRWWSPLAGRIGAQFFKINATENLFAAQALRLAREAVPGSMRGDLVSDEPLVSLRSVYNPFGRVLVGLASEYRAYAWSAWDAAAFQRLVRLGYEIRRQRIAPAVIPAFLQQHPELATHPGDGRPFLWEAAGGELRVQTMAREAGIRSFSIHVWPAPAGQ